MRSWRPGNSALQLLLNHSKKDPIAHKIASNRHSHSHSCLLLSEVKMVAARSPSTTTTSAASETEATIGRLVQYLDDNLRSNVGERVDASHLNDLRRLFSQLISAGEVFRNDYSGSNDNNSDFRVAQQMWDQWLQSQFHKFVNHLCTRVRLGRRYALRTLCGVVACAPTYANLTPFTTATHKTTSARGGNVSTTPNVIATQDEKCQHYNNTSWPTSPNARIHEKLMYAMIEALCIRQEQQSPIASKTNEPSLLIDEPMLTLLSSEFIIPYKDVQYFTLMAIRDIASNLIISNDLKIKRLEQPHINEHEHEPVKHVMDQHALKSKKKEKYSSTTITAIIIDNLVRVIQLVPVVTSDEEVNGITAKFLFNRGASAVVSENIINTADYDEDLDMEQDDESDSDSDLEYQADDDVVSELARQKKRSRLHVQDDTTTNNNCNNFITGNSSINNNNNNKTKLLKTSPLSINNVTKTPLYSSLRYRRRLLEESWLSLLRLGRYMSSSTHVRILQHLPIQVLPYIHHPLQFAEYYTQSYKNTRHGTSLKSSGGGSGGGGNLISILALQGLFLLMTKHGLEYPQFYTSLYSLIHPFLFYVKYRQIFFKLLSQCLLQSQMIPAYVIASFCKRLCRCALYAPPSGSLFVLALVSNLLRKHETCSCLIHRAGGSGDNDGEGLKDVYDARTNDPLQSRALESSLWELLSLERHYHPAVAALAKACGTEDPSKTPLHNMNDFLVHTYQSLFEQETKRRLGGGVKGTRTRTTPVTFKEPDGVFVNGDVFSGIISWPSKP